MNADTTGKTSVHEPATDWRRLHEMEDDAASAEDPDVSPLDEDSWKKARLVGKPSKASLSAARFQRTVTRVTIEACWLHRYQTAIDRLQNVEAVGTDFFRIAYSALLDGRLIRLLSLLEESNRCASFWYLRRINPNIVDAAVAQAGIDLKMLKELSTKLRPIRNGAFVHIDKHEVFNPQRLYHNASIQIRDLNLICTKLHEMMEEIYRVTFKKNFEYDEYDGSDILRLAGLRDVAENRKQSKQRLGL
jgi:hypothetical protein